MVHTKGGIDLVGATVGQQQDALGSTTPAEGDATVGGDNNTETNVAGSSNMAADSSSSSLKKSRKEHKLLAEGAGSGKKSASSSAAGGSSGNSLLSPGSDSSGNLNKTIVSKELLNPKTLEVLSKKELRKLERLAAVAGVSLPEYVSKIKFGSPEWNWL